MVRAQVAKKSTKPAKRGTKAKIAKSSRPRRQHDAQGGLEYEGSARRSTPQSGRSPVIQALENTRANSGRVQLSIRVTSEERRELHQAALDAGIDVQELVYGALVAQGLLSGRATEGNRRVDQRRTISGARDKGIERGASHRPCSCNHEGSAVLILGELDLKNVEVFACRRAHRG